MRVNSSKPNYSYSQDVEKSKKSDTQTTAGMFFLESNKADIENLLDRDIYKRVSENIRLNDEEKDKLKPMIEGVVEGGNYTVQLEPLNSNALPFQLTQPEFMRRMKEMQQTGGGGGMMGNMPEMFNIVVNTNHELVGQILNTRTQKKRDRLIQQAVDLAKLSQNLLKGEELTQFIQRSVDLIK